MAILIASGNDKTRLILRHLLREAGFDSPITEARNPLETISHLKREGDRISLLIMDYDSGCSDLTKLLQQNHADSAAYLMIGSSRTELLALSASALGRRLDAHLAKPFRSKSLVDAIHRAQMHRRAQRRTLVYLGPRDKTFQNLQIAMSSDHRTHWKKILPMETLQASALGQELKPVQNEIGAILFEPDHYFRMKSDWLGGFKKSHKGMNMVAACLSRDPERLGSLRTHCDLFVEPGGNLTDWLLLLKKLASKALHSGMMKNHLNAFRSAILRGDYSAARNVAKQMLELDDDSQEAHDSMAFAAERLGKIKEATLHYQRSIAINPCYPRPYIRLLEILPAPLTKERFQLADKAVAYCPNNVGVLMTAVKVWKDVPNSTKAALLMERAGRVDHLLLKASG